MLHMFTIDPAGIDATNKAILREEGGNGFPGLREARSNVARRYQWEASRREQDRKIREARKRLSING